MGGQWHTIGQIPQKCKETSNLIDMFFFYFGFFKNLFCTIANLRIKCVTETKSVSVLFYKNIISFDSEVSLHYCLLLPTVRRLEWGKNYINGKFIKNVSSQTKNNFRFTTGTKSINQQTIGCHFFV